MKRFLITLTSATFLFIFLSCSSKDQKAVQTAKVKKGTFHVEVVETGDIYADQSTNITAPAMSLRFGALKIVKIIDDGK